jgi:hypothetical protein
MKRIITLAIFTLCFALISCATQKKWVDISDKVDTEQMMREHFPKLYDDYKNGYITVHKIKQTTDKDGNIRYQVTYKEKSNSSEFEDWLPMLIMLSLDK